LVTRGDVNLDEIVYSIADAGIPFIKIWDNSKREDLSVYGRYAAIEYTDADLIYVQDDDCIVSDPQALVRAWKDAWRAGIQGKTGTLQFHSDADLHIVCNMPPEFRHDFYTDHALVGFGAVFHRDAPERAFERIFPSGTFDPAGTDWYDYTLNGIGPLDAGFFHRTCDIVFTGLTPRVLVDVPKTNLWWAEDESRMYRQPQHVEERLRMLELVKQVRDAS